jgi:hypothetical protein
MVETAPVQWSFNCPRSFFDTMPLIRQELTGVRKVLPAIMKPGTKGAGSLPEGKPLAARHIDLAAGLALLQPSPLQRRKLRGRREGQVRKGEPYRADEDRGRESEPLHYAMSS